MDASVRGICPGFGAQEVAQPQTERAPEAVARPGDETSVTPKTIPWWKSTRVAYALRCAGLTTALVTAPAAVMFAAAYDELNEGVARADQDHLVREIRRHPECLQPPKCRALTVLGFRPGARTERKSAALVASVTSQPGLGALFLDSFDSEWLHPVRPLLNQLPPLDMVMSDATGRLYRVCPTSADLGWNWHRRMDSLVLNFGGERHEVRLAPMIGMCPELLLTLLASVVVIGLLSYLAYLSLARLLFLRLLTTGGDANRIARVQDSQQAQMNAWQGLSPEERRVLGQLAIDGYVAPHPTNEDILRALATKDLLSPATLTIRSSHLMEIARENFPAETLDECERKGGTHTWSLVRAPLTAGVGVILLCLGFSQADLTTAGLTIPSALSIVPMLLQMFRRMAVPKG